MIIAIILTITADILFAVSGVLQQGAASSIDYVYNLKFKLISKLFKSKKWFIGFVLSLFGYIVSFVALDFGSLVLVESLMILNFLLALPLSNIVKKQKINVTELLYSFVTVCGLIIFLIVANSKDMTKNYTISKLILAVVIIGVISVFFTLLAVMAKSKNLRTFWLASSGSLMNTLLALEIKQAINNLDKSGHASEAFRFFDSVGIYLVIPTFVVALLIIQSAFQTEKLSWSLPSINLINPVAATIVAVTIFGATIRNAWWALALEVIGVILVTFGIIKLSSDKTLVSGSA